MIRILAPALVLVGLAAAAQQTALQAPGGAGTGAEKADEAFCRASCAPRNLVFLPCMAVGATKMASCREREIATCLRACASRGSSP